MLPVLNGLGESLPVLGFGWRAFFCVFVAVLVGAGAYVSTCAKNETERRCDDRNQLTRIADFCFFFAIVGGVCAISEMGVHNSSDPLWASRASGYLILWGTVFTGVYAVRDKKATPYTVIGACFVVFAVILYAVNSFSGHDTLNNVKKTTQETTDWNYLVYLATREDEEAEREMLRMSADGRTIILYTDGKDGTIVPIVLEADKVCFKEDHSLETPKLRRNIVQETWVTYYNDTKTDHKAEVGETFTVWIRNFDQIPEDCRFATHLGKVPSVQTATATG